jgi:hypothetical protein
MNLRKVPVRETMDHTAAKSAQLWFCKAVVTVLAVSIDTTVLAILDCVSVKYMSIKIF